MCPVLSLQTWLVCLPWSGEFCAAFWQVLQGWWAPQAIAFNNSKLCCLTGGFEL